MLKVLALGSHTVPVGQAQLVPVPPQRSLVRMAPLALATLHERDCRQGGEGGGRRVRWVWESASAMRQVGGVHVAPASACRRAPQVGCFRRATGEHSNEKGSSNKRQIVHKCSVPSGSEREWSLA